MTSKKTHSWKKTEKTVHHEEVGHYEQKYIPGYTAIHCCGCGVDFDSVEAYEAHRATSDGYATACALSRYYTNHIPGKYIQTWVVDKSAYDEIKYSYTCSSCGAVK